MVVRQEEAERGSGWLFFAGTVLGMAGLMRIFDAFWVFYYDGQVPEALDGAILGDDLDTYGWVFLVVGVLLLLASFAVLIGVRLAGQRVSAGV